MNIDIEVPAGLDPRLTALGWLVGSWEGTGNGTDADGNDFTFEQRIQFAPADGASMFYLAQAYRLDSDGKPADILDVESGFWRPKPDASLEVTLTNAGGWTEVLVGRIQVTRIDLQTDAVVRTESAAVEHSAGQRLYGQVEGDLMYALDRATTTHPLRPHMWARLKRS